MKRLQRPYGSVSRDIVPRSAALRGMAPGGTGYLSVAAFSLGAAAIAATAVGVLAVGAMSVGSLAIGNLAIGGGRVRRLRIDQLDVGRFNEQVLSTQASSAPLTTPMVRPNEAGHAEQKPYYFEDFEVGQQWRSGTVTVNAADIKAFAAAFDPQPFHLDEVAAAASPFGGLVASGWHTAALTMRLLTSGGLPIGNGIIGAGGDIAWPRPVRPGDVLHVVSEVLEARPSRSRPNIGLVTVRSTTSASDNAAVQVLKATLVVPRRAAANAKEQT